MTDNKRLYLVLHKFLPLLLFGQFVLCEFSTRLAAAETWGGTGTYHDPFWYKIVAANGDGFFRKRGQTEAAGIWHDSVDSGHDLDNGKKKQSFGSICAFRKTTENQATSTKIKLDLGFLFLKVEEIEGADDKTEWRAENMVAERWLANDDTGFWATADYVRQSMTAPVGAAVPVSKQFFGFSADNDPIPEGSWSLDLYADISGDVRVCETFNGNFWDEVEIDMNLTSFQVAAFTTSIANILTITNAWQFAGLALGFPDPYLVFNPNHITEEYIHEYDPDWIPPGN